MTAIQQRMNGRPLSEDFERIFREHHDLVYRVAYRITGTPEDAEDVLQTLFLRLLRRDCLPDIERNPKAYLHRASINIALDLIKVRNRSVTSADVEERLEDTSPHQERRQSGLEVQEWLRTALSELSPKAAEIFVLRHVEGYDNAEIAKLVGTSRGDSLLFCSFAHGQG